MVYYISHLTALLQAHDSHNYTLCTEIHSSYIVQKKALIWQFNGFCLVEIPTENGNILIVLHVHTSLYAHII